LKVFLHLRQEITTEGQFAVASLFVVSAT
jgi:hypothetical protein